MFLDELNHIMDVKRGVLDHFEEREEQEQEGRFLDTITSLADELKTLRQVEDLYKQYHGEGEKHV